MLLGKKLLSTENADKLLSAELPSDADIIKSQSKVQDVSETLHH